ncbi:MAG: TIM barrel protein [Firmicutes bacterium]|jgi:inosose dehydratase|nr:TIM barrel protein [Bacillota bacterium]
MRKGKLAYAIWPWGLEEKEQMIQALKDVKSIGYNAFESVESAIDLFDNNVKMFKEVIAEYDVWPVSFYFWQKGDFKKDSERLKRKLDFMAELGIQRMSVQAPNRKVEMKLDEVLELINHWGELAAPYGILPCIHPHHGTLVMYEEEIDFIMQNTDPRKIAFGPDTAHLVAGRCDPVEIFARYAERIAFVHLKDLKKAEELETTDDRHGFEVYGNFMELGEGDIDFAPIFKVLDDVSYDGYLTLELDRSRTTNAHSAQINMDYMQTHYYKRG